LANQLQRRATLTAMAWWIWSWVPVEMMGPLVRVLFTFSCSKLMET